MQQGFTKSVQGFKWIVWIVTLLSVIQCDKECCFLHSIKTLPVFPLSKVGITGACPGNPEMQKVIMSRLTTTKKPQKASFQ